MTTDRFIIADRLAQLLKVSRITLKNWGTEGLIARFRLNGYAHYTESAINSFLKSCAHNLVSPLTFEDLRSGTVELLTEHEATEYSGYSSHILKDVNKTGIQYIFLTPQNKRFVKSSIPIKPTFSGSIGLELATHITGLALATLKAYVTKGILKKQSGGRGKGPVRIAPEQMLDFLKIQLPDWINPQNWYDDRLDSPLPLLCLEDTVRQLGTIVHFNEAMQAKELLYICTNHRQNVHAFLPESIAGFVEREPPIDVSKIGVIIGVSPGVLYDNWRKYGYRLCPLHDHTEWGYRKTCILAFLKNALPAYVSPDRWFARQTTDPQELFHLLAAMERLGKSRQEVLDAIAAGTLKGLRLPNENYRFTERQLTNYLRMQR
ncbi:MAG TPA: hypothetical protein VLG40_04185 [Candidatus Saccharimonas sp.]|nr:hypothetical protein [Candidatus Saccharimonas sp.]